MSEAHSSTQKIKVFFSYSHRDEPLREELEKHLSSLRRQSIISEWHDRKIIPGHEWAREIDEHLKTAQIILLLISADFIHSDYCYGIELELALKRHEAKECLVIPIILRPVYWEHSPFGKLQALPKNAKAVTSWTNQDEAFTDIAQGISVAVKRFIQRFSKTNDTGVQKSLINTQSVNPNDKFIREIRMDTNSPSNNIVSDKNVNLAGVTSKPPIAIPIKPHAFKDLRGGMQLEGKITSIALYGVFVDVGVGRDGLVHISEMSDTWIESPTELVQIGDPVTVWVKSVDPDARRFSLTMRDPNKPKPQRERRGPRKPEVDRENLTEARVQEQTEDQALLARLAETARLAVSSVVETVAERAPEVAENVVGAAKHLRVPSGMKLEGKVTSIAPFGVFVDVGMGRDGLVHISEMSDTRIESPTELVQIGDPVTVWVKSVDPDTRRLNLTMRDPNK